MKLDFITLSFKKYNEYQIRFQEVI